MNRRAFTYIQIMIQFSSEYAVLSINRIVGLFVVWKRSNFAPNGNLCFLKRLEKVWAQIPYKKNSIFLVAHGKQWNTWDCCFREVKPWERSNFPKCAYAMFALWWRTPVFLYWKFTLITTGLILNIPLDSSKMQISSAYSFYITFDYILKTILF